MVLEKICTQCGKEKLLTEYRTDKRASNGHRSECAECTRKYTREWRQCNIEKVRAYHRRWYKENKDTAQDYMQKWREKNPNYDRQQAQAWAIAHPEQRKETQRAYFERTREAHRQRERTYRARKRNATIETITEEGWMQIILSYDSCCVYCGHKCESPSMDHIVPISKGGSHSYDNIVPACLECNCKKGARTPKEANMPIILEPQPLPSQP